MRYPITGVSIVLFFYPLDSVIGRDSISEEGLLASSDETSLLQAAATAKSGSARAAETSSTKCDTGFCFEPEVHHVFSAEQDFEPLGIRLSLGATAPERFEGPKVAASPVVLVVRMVLLLLTFAIAAHGSMRWFERDAELLSFARRSCSSASVSSPRHRKRAPAVAAPDSATGTATVAPQHSAFHAAALASDDVRCQSMLGIAGLLSGSGPRRALFAPDAWGTTPLHAAAASGSRAIAESLLEHGVPVDPIDAWDETPLHLAARGGHAEVCELLAERGASLRALNAEDWTPLVVAGHAGQEAVCRSLLALGAGAEGLALGELPRVLQELMAETTAEATPSAAGALG